MGVVDVDLQGIGEVLGSVGGFAKDIRSALTGEMNPEKRAELEAKTLEMQTTLAVAQSKINIEEAKHKSLFVAGARPFILWVCGMGVAYKFLINPIIEWIVMIKGITYQYVDPATGKAVIKLLEAPEINAGELVTLLIGILGLGAYRTYEKKVGVHGRH